MPSPRDGKSYNAIVDSLNGRLEGRQAPTTSLLGIYRPAELPIPRAQYPHEAQYSLEAQYPLGPQYSPGAQPFSGVRYVPEERHIPGVRHVLPPNPRDPVPPVFYEYPPDSTHSLDNELYEPHQPFDRYDYMPESQRVQQPSPRGRSTTTSYPRECSPEPEKKGRKGRKSPHQSDRKDSTTSRARDRSPKPLEESQKDRESRHRQHRKRHTTSHAKEGSSRPEQVILATYEDTESDEEAPPPPPPECPSPPNSNSVNYICDR